jgi:hypothetical protein
MMTRRQFGGVFGWLAGMVARLTLTCRSYAASDPDFTLAAIPDAQYNAQDCTGMYAVMMNRIIADRTAYNIKAVLGEGDTLHVPSTSSSAQATVATSAFGLLDAAGIPHISCPGNHDYFNPANADRTSIGWHFRSGSYFGAAARAAVFGSGISMGGGDMAYWVGSYDPYSGTTPTQDSTNSGAATAIRLMIGRRRILVIATPYYADSPSLVWAKALHDTYAAQGYEVIVLAHGYLTTHPADTTPLTRTSRWGPSGGTQALAAAPYSNSGLELWRGYFPSDTADPSDVTNVGFRNWSNHLLTLGGHVIDPLVGGTYYDGAGSQYINSLDLVNNAGRTNHGLMCNLQQRDSNADTANASCTSVSSTFGDDRAHLLYMMFSPSNQTLKLRVLSANTGLWAGSLTVPASGTPYCASSTPVDLVSLSYPGIPAALRGLPSAVVRKS